MGADYKFSPLAHFEYQPPALLDQPNPAQNTFYELLNEIGGVRVYDLCINIAAVGETLEIAVSVDGVLRDHAPFAAPPGADNLFYVRSSAILQQDRINQDAGVSSNYRAFFVEGHHVIIEVRKTTAAGAGNLQAIASFGLLRRI